MLSALQLCLAGAKWPSQTLQPLQEYSDIAWAKNQRKIWKTHAYE